MAKKILLIEDHQIARKVSALVFTQLGCVVTQAANATAALDNVEKNPFDLILVDIGLPDMDGLMLIEKMTQMESANKKTPIIVLTAHEDQEYRSKCALFGVSEFVIKPLTFEKGEQVLRQYCS